MTMTFLNPFGVLIQAKEKLPLAAALEAASLKKLIKQHPIVLMRGFIPPTKDELVAYAKGIGPLLEWDFGNVMEMRVHEQPKNYLFTHGEVPLHWDGAFHQVPRYLLFHCVEAPLPHTGGETLFCNTQKIWQNATHEARNAWEKLTLTYKTEKLAHYGGHISVPLVQAHPETGETVLRFAEPVSAPQLNPVEVWIENQDLDVAQRFIAEMRALCYSEQNCYVHAWQENDFLIADNNALIHGRHAFKQFSPRHLRRIQIL